MTIKSDKDVFEINGISASEYVALPEVPRENSLSLETNLFEQGISKVEYAVTEKNFSPVLTGILLKSKKYDDGNKLTFVGTDSFRLAEFKTNNMNNNDDFSLIIPKLAITDLQRVAEFARDKECEEIQIHYSDNLVAFQVNIGETKILATSLLIQ
ncbi:DNA polymerase III subunit beta [Patescibacteria group bacterium]|nr:DNA polymerase III subunit beta [Patescibacteria group bacterium]MBU1758627.1 DNA polymerase III subunit beta [Patescibacteria group bacterium]